MSLVLINVFSYLVYILFVKLIISIQSQKKTVKKLCRAKYRVTINILQTD